MQKNNISSTRLVGSIAFLVLSGVMCFCVAGALLFAAVGSDPITPTVLIISVFLFFALLTVAAHFGITSSRFRSSLVALSFCILAFILYRQPAVYDHGIARGDFDFGFPLRYVTSQDDSNPYRFRISSLAIDAAAASGAWLLLFVTRELMRRRHSPLSTNEPSTRTI